MFGTKAQGGDLPICRKSSLTSFSVTEKAKFETTNFSVFNLGTAGATGATFFPDCWAYGVDRCPPRCGLLVLRTAPLERPPRRLFWVADLDLAIWSQVFSVPSFLLPVSFQERPLPLLLRWAPPHASDGLCPATPRTSGLVGAKEQQAAVQDKRPCETSRRLTMSSKDMFRVSAILVEVFCGKKITRDRDYIITCPYSY